MIRKKNPVSGPANKEAAKELAIYISSAGPYYTEQQVPIIRSLVKKFNKGVYDSTKALKLWLPYVDRCAKKYAKEFSHGSEWNRIFNRNTRLIVAKELEDYILGEIELGNWDK